MYHTVVNDLDTPEGIIGLAAFVWLLSIIGMSLGRLVKNIIQGHPRPRREAMLWSSGYSSHVATVVALVLSWLYVFVRWQDWGWAAAVWVGAVIGFLFLWLPTFVSDCKNLRRKTPVDVG